jgi:hypothetical protein
MRAVQRDYIERMIEQFAQAITEIANLIRTGQFDPILVIVRRTSEAALAPLLPMLEQLDAASFVELLGKYEVDRIRMYAALLGEEGTVHQLRGQLARAHDRWRHALELCTAISLSGARLKPADCDRAVEVRARVDPGTIRSHYSEELSRLAGGIVPSV